MAGLHLLASSRPTFNAGAKTLTYDVPAIAKGSLLVIVAAFDPADGYVLPAGWTVLGTLTGTAKLVLLGRMVDDNEPAKVVLALTTAAKDWLGQLLVFDAGAPATVLESSARSDFAADATPPSPGPDSQQAINLEVRAWSVSTAMALTAPAGMTQIDSYSTAIATARSFLIAYAVANATGNLAAKDATAGAAATGSSGTWVLRDRPPITPGVMNDPVPGNIGLL